MKFIEQNLEKLKLQSLDKSQSLLIYAVEKISFFVSRENDLFWSGGGEYQKFVTPVDMGFPSKMMDINGVSNRVVEVCKHGELFLGNLNTNFSTFDRHLIPCHILINQSFHLILFTKWIKQSYLIPKLLHCVRTKYSPLIMIIHLLEHG